MADRQRHSVARLEGKSRSSMRPTERDEEADAGYKRRRTEIRPPQHEKRHEEPETKKSRRTTTGAHHTVSSPAAAKSSKDKRREVVREEHVAASPAAAKSSKMKRRETRDEVEREQPSPSPRAAKSFRSSKQDRREAEEAGSKSTAAEGKSKAEGKKPLPKDKGKAPALAAAAGGYKTAREEAEAEAYDSLGASCSFHQHVPVDMPEVKRLQRLVELVMEAEQTTVSARYEGRLAFIASALEEVAAQFIMDTERHTIRAVNKTRASIGRPAQTAFARGEVSEMKPNPLNDQRSAQEKTLHDALAAFEKEDAEWTALLNAPAPAPPAPPRAGAPVLEELSIADRNLLSSRATDELPELVGWAQGLVATGLDKMRAAVANAEEQAHKAAARRERLVGNLRTTARAPYAAVTDPKQLLRSVVSS